MPHWSLERLKAEPTVVVLRPDNLGDLVLFSGSLRHLRGLYPDARIRIYVRGHIRGLLDECPYVDEVRPWESLAGIGPGGVISLLKGATRALGNQLVSAEVAILPVRSPTDEMLEVFDSLRATRKYLMTGSDSNRRAPVSAIPTSAQVSAFHLTNDREREHELKVNREFLNWLGAGVEEGGNWPEFWTTDADRAWAEERMSGIPGTTVLAIAPGASSPRGKVYPVQRYREVLQEVTGETFSVVLLGTTGDVELCRELEGALQGCQSVASMANLAGESTIRQMVECVRRSDLLLCVDAAASHIGIALRKPTVCIVGGGQAGRFHPWGNPLLNRMVQLPMDCFGCDWNCRFSTMRCVQEISVAAVLQQLEEALRFSRPRLGIDAELR